jgi:hypothetical protein
MEDFFYNAHIDLGTRHGYVSGIIEGKGRKPEEVFNSLMKGIAKNFKVTTQEVEMKQFNRV